MVNRSARRVPVTPFRAEARLPDGQLPVARPRGEDNRRIATSLSGLARQFGQMGDTFAAIEGRRAGASAGNDPDFRPTGAMTIRGRNFDAAGISSYVANLDAQMRSDMQDVYQAHENDPDGLKGALDDLKTLYERDHVFEEILPTFNADFERARIGYQNRALDNFNADRKAAAYGSLIERLNELSTTRSRALASLDPHDPAAVDMLVDMTGAIGDEYDRAVDGELMTPAAAATAKIADRRSAAVNFYTRQAGEIGTPAELETFRGDLRQRHAAGELVGIDGEGFAVLESNLQSIANRLETEGRSARSTLKKQIDSHVDRVAAGLSPPADEWQQILLAANGVPGGEEVVALGEAKLRVAEVIRDQPLPSARATVDGLRRSIASDATPAGAELVGFAEKQIETETQRVGTDMLGAAERRRLISEIVPLSLSAEGVGEGLAGEVSARVAQADAVAEAVGRVPQYLRPAEVADLKTLAATNPDAAIAAAAAIIEGGGAAAPDILKQLDSQARALSAAGVVMANGGSIEASRDILLGSRAPEGGGQWPTLTPTTRGRIGREVLGLAMVAQPEDTLRTQEAAYNIAKVRIAGNGTDPRVDVTAAEQVYRDALAEAAGAVTVGGEQYGGVADYSTGFFSFDKKVIVPPAIKASEFSNVVKSIRDEDLAALPAPPETEDGRAYRARDLHHALPVWTALGYMFSLGDPTDDDPRFIRGADGNPFMLDIEAMIPELRRRVPGAFLGE